MKVKVSFFPEKKRVIRMCILFLMHNMNCSSSYTKGGKQMWAVGTYCVKLFSLRTPRCEGKTHRTLSFCFFILYSVCLIQTNEQQRQQQQNSALDAINYVFYFIRMNSCIICFSLGTYTFRMGSSNSSSVILHFVVLALVLYIIIYMYLSFSLLVMCF